MSNEGYGLAYEYTVRFYPRYFTWVQFQINSENSKRQGVQIANRLTGPLGMGPEYKVVVAINDDTIYAEAFLDVSQTPVILTIPKYPNRYSILQLDVYGNIFSTDLSENPPSRGGDYAFVPQGYKGRKNLPRKARKIELPYTFSTIAIRIDKHSSTGENYIEAANQFRSNLSMQTLEEYDAGSDSGKTLVLPLHFFAPSVKLMADQGIATAPEAFLTTVQEAMASSMTQPLTDDDRELMRRFDAAFAHAKKVIDRDSGPLTEIIRGAQAAWAALINRWHSHRGATNWIHFDNIGHWGRNYLDRAALTEYIQVGNDRKAAYYANAFVDASGLPLDGGSFAYTIQFAKNELPKYQRFWSMTAYTPEYVELVPNVLDKYVVASYTEGLVTAKDGSVTIYVQADPPKRPSLTPNWLPVPKGFFSLLFRVYGPEGKALAGTYVPPKIHRSLAS